MERVGKNADAPRPDLYRENFNFLNGEWDFEFDDQNQGIKEKWFDLKGLEKRITVPFCFQSKASGIGLNEKHEIVWYKKKVTIPEGMKEKNVRIFFGAVDYETDVWINGQHVKKHIGGHTPFDLGIMDYIEANSNTFDVTLRVLDPFDIHIPRGKQHWNIQKDRCWYTNTTGIWQDVWLEATEGKRIEKLKLTPDIDSKSVKVEMVLEEAVEAAQLEWVLTFKQKNISKGTIILSGKYINFTLNVYEEDPIDNTMHLWSCKYPNLYDLELIFIEKEKEQDRLKTYFGMRKIEVRGDKILLNHVPLYQKLVLDQGYWPDTLMTPMNDQTLIKDIELVKLMGFNGVRKHQKIEVPKFYYFADRMGLLVWSEMPSAYGFNNESMTRIISEWSEVIERDYNHPSIITWVPMNESWGIRDVLFDKHQQDFALSLYHWTKAMDSSRIVSTNDGWEMLTSDICTVHDYISDGTAMYDKYKDVEKLFQWTAVGKMLYCDGYHYGGEPIIISEFGGVAFEDNNETSWGYNDKVTDDKMFINRVKGLVDTIDQLGYTSGYCYTQFTDVEQEKNGLLNADRTPKIEINRISKLFR